VRLLLFAAPFTVNYLTPRCEQLYSRR
jgi:hypothetical protein